jgi:hypothetical protein
MGNYGVPSEHQDADKNMDSKDCAHEISDTNKGSIGKCTRNHLCYTLAKKLSTFCPFPEILWEAEFKHDRLIWQSKCQGSPSTKQLQWYYWILLGQIYNEKGNAKQSRI